MDEELQGTAAATGEDENETNADEGGDAAKEARILSNLLQSLHAGLGSSGPVQNMMKAMGQEPPFVTPEED